MIEFSLDWVQRKKHQSHHDTRLMYPLQEVYSDSFCSKLKGNMRDEFPWTVWDVHFFPFTLHLVNVECHRICDITERKINLIVTKISQTNILQIGTQRWKVFCALDGLILIQPIYDGIAITYGARNDSHTYSHGDTDTCFKFIYGSWILLSTCWSMLRWSLLSSPSFSFYKPAKW